MNKFIDLVGLSRFLIKCKELFLSKEDAAATIESLKPFIIESNQARVVEEDIDGHIVIVVSDSIYNDAKTAFLNGRTVLIKKIDGLAYHVVGYSDDIINNRGVAGEEIEGLALYNRSTGDVSAYLEAYALISESNV